jgi:putative membrane protein
MLTPESEQRIADAVGAAEAACGAEVVVVGYHQADSYAEVAWRNAVLAAVVALTAVILVPMEIDEHLVVPVVVAALVGAFLLSQLRPVLRLTSTKRARAAAVDNAVARAFVDRGVHKTRDRVGLLVVWCELERAVRVVFDSGLEHRVPKDVRAQMVKALDDAMLDDARRPAVIAALGQAIAPFVARGADDTNELADAPTRGAA